MCTFAYSFQIFPLLTPRRVHELNHRHDFLAYLSHPVSTLTCQSMLTKISERDFRCKSGTVASLAG